MPFKCLLYYSSDFNHLWRNGFLSFKLLLCCLFSFYLHVWDSPTQRLLHTIFSFTCSRICRENLPWLFDAGICRENLPQEFAVAICRENLSQEFAGCTCKQICFSTCEQILFIWKQTFFIREQNFFVRFSLLTVFLFAIAVTVMGHRKIVFLIVKYIFKLLAIQES